MITFQRVPNRFFGMRDLAFCEAGIRDLGLERERDAGSQMVGGTREMAIDESGCGISYLQGPRSEKNGDKN